MIPSELTTIDHWISWKPVNQDKKPLGPNGRVANALDPANWQSLIKVMTGQQPECCKLHMLIDTNFNEHHLMNNMTHLICHKCRSGKHIPTKTDHVGFVLTGDYVVIDGDHEPWITELTDRYVEKTYCEVSPNGGIHVWLRGKHKNQRGHFEVYNDKRWMTVTGIGNDLAISKITEEDKKWISKMIKSKK
jgi:primase-polymerase (primpol)-like protein